MRCWKLFIAWFFKKLSSSPDFQKGSGFLHCFPLSLCVTREKFAELILSCYYQVSSLTCRPIINFLYQKKICTRFNIVALFSMQQWPTDVAFNPFYSKPCYSGNLFSWAHFVRLLQVLSVLLNVFEWVLHFSKSVEVWKWVYKHLWVDTKEDPEIFVDHTKAFHLFDSRKCLLHTGYLCNRCHHHRKTSFQDQRGRRATERARALQKLVCKQNKTNGDCHSRELRAQLTPKFLVCVPSTTTVTLFLSRTNSCFGWFVIWLQKVFWWLQVIVAETCFDDQMFALLYAEDNLFCTISTQRTCFPIPNDRLKE